MFLHGASQKTQSMKKTLLLIALLLPIGTMQAQHMQSDPVEPASKGPLPELPVLAEPEEGHFGGLKLDYTTLSPFQGKNWSYEAELSFPTPASLGGESYTLQVKRSYNDWETYNESNTITGSGQIVYSMGCTYRLRLNGGDKDGWLSNEAYVPYHSIPSQKKNTQTWGNQETFVGSTLRSSSITIYVYNDIQNLSSYTSYKDDDSFIHTWYRRNPNTGEMTSTGVHDANYVVTVDDVGYEMVEVIEGDKKKTDFYFSNTIGIAKLAVCSSAEFFYEGFIVNTEYDLPNPQALLGFSEYDEELGASVIKPFAPENFRVLAPGRYAILCPWEKYGWQYMYTTNNMIGICEKVSDYYIRQLYLWAGAGQLETHAMQDGVQLDGANVNLLEKNIDGNMQYVYTSTNDYLTAVSYVTLYAKAVNVGEGNLPTYYPSALLWTEAQPFDIQSMHMSEEGPHPIDIEVRRDFGPLGGECTIDGLIVGEVPEAKPLLSASSPDVVGTWCFYMTDENGEPIRTEDMLRVKVTFNEDGTYTMEIPIWNEVQSGRWSWWNTGTTLYFQVEKLVKNGTVYEGNELLEYWGVTENDERMKFRTDISFNADGCLIMNIFGLPDSVYEPEGGIQQGEAEPVYVYLRVKGGDIVAATVMQADGSYRFEGVPYGTYEVIPNIDGYNVNYQTVKLTPEQTSATLEEYCIYKNNDIITSIASLQVAPDGPTYFYDLSGRRIASERARGIIIKGGKKVHVK